MGPPRPPFNIHTRTTESERAALAADRARIAFLDLRIPELEAALKALQREKHIVQNRLDAYTYPVLSLPNEITSEIFVHFLPAYPIAPPPIGPFSPYQLCHICRQWRGIALTTPALWRALSLSLREAKRFNHAHHLLESLLARSGSCLLSIELQITILDESLQLPQFGQAIAMHWTQLEHLTLSVPRPLDGLPDKDLPLPHLRTLKLGRRLENSTTTFLAAPLLRKVKLQAYHDTPRSVIPWSQLTVVCVCSIRLSSCVNILGQLVNVTSCRFILDFSPFDLDIGLSPTNITLPHLETLILESPPLYSTDVNIFNALTLPTLRRLQVPLSLLASGTALELLASSTAALFDQSRPLSSSRGVSWMSRSHFFSRRRRMQRVECGCRTGGRQGRRQ
ncbi:hypothetical protein C8R47DRAFT_1163928 [Mycena vitilis]|nr:hypothetical protein C8R47DRAFT_1163928 [Mycena vitilis]